MLSQRWMYVVDVSAFFLGAGLGSDVAITFMHDEV